MGERAGNLRPVAIQPDFIAGAEGSVLIAVGKTRVICAASIDESVPPFLRGKNRGWVTSEYAMLPRATDTRTLGNPVVAGSRAGLTRFSA